MFLSERLTSLLVIRSFACEKQILEEATEKMEDHKAARMKRSHFSNASNIGFGLIMCLYPLDSGERYIVASNKEKIPLNGKYIWLFSYVLQGNHLMSGTIREIVQFL